MNLAWRKAVRDSRDKYVDSTAVAVAFTLDSYADKTGYCWPSRATIAAGAKLTDKTVDQALRRLEHAGFLTASRSKGRTSNRYWLTFPNSGVAPLLDAPPTTEHVRGNHGADDPVTTESTTSNHGADDPLTGSNQPFKPANESGGWPEEKTFQTEPANEQTTAPLPADVAKWAAEMGMRTFKSMPPE